jgi:hypothetical protein
MKRASSTPRRCAIPRRRFLTAAVILLAACARGGDAGRSPAADSIPEGQLVLPPSAGAARAPMEAGYPDTLVPGAPDDTLAPEGTVGNVPPATLDLRTIVNAYRRFYGQIYVEMGSSVRGNVDGALVEEAKHRTALEFGYVDANAWNDMLADLAGDERADLAERIVANRALAAELHGAQAPR